MGVAVTCPGTTLAVGGVMTCTASGLAVAGQYENIGTATGTDPVGQTVSASNPDHYYGQLAALTIVTRTNGTNNDTGTGPKLTIGSTVTWSYAVQNTGNVTLSGVTLSDSKVGAVCTPGTLAPGATASCTKSGKAVAGQYENIGTVTGTSPLNQQATASNPDHYYGVTVCDVNGDGKIDNSDINLIFSAINLKVGVGDPRDFDSNGIISINDSRNCVLRCSKANCAL
jgi:hypothetical protein